MIKSYLRGEQEEWDLNLQYIAAAYRATQQESTSLTPNLLMLGREVRHPLEMIIGDSTQEGNLINSGKYAAELKERLQKAHSIAQKHLQASARRQKDNYNHKLQQNQYREGQLVWMKNEERREGISPKLQPSFVGPFLITKKYNALDYEIHLNGKQKKVVHHDKLQPYHGDRPPDWAKKLKKKFKLP